MSTILLSDRLSRFILEKSKIKPSTNEVRYQAFLPHNGETSVFKTSNMSNSDIWNTGKEHVETPQKRTIIARGDIEASYVKNNGLEVQLAEPPINHANIIDWPTEKSKQIEIAILLANNSTLSIK